MFMRLVTPSTRRLLDGVGRDGRANVKVFARCKRAINDVRPEGFEGRAPRNRLVETERRAEAKLIQQPVETHSVSSETLDLVRD